MQSQKRIEQRPPFLALLKGAFHDSAVYGRFRYVPMGRAISFFALFVFLLIFAGTVFVCHRLTVELGTLAGEFDTRLPEIRIENGEAKVDRPMPIVLEPTKHDDPAVIIDTTGQITNIDKYGAAVLLTKNKLLTKGSGRPAQETDLSKVQNFVLNKSTVLDWKSKVISVAFPLILIFWFFYKLIVSLIEIALFALLSLLFPAARNMGISYGELFNIALLATIPPTIITLLLFFVNIGGVASWLIFVIVYFIYILYMLDRLEKTQEAEAKEDAKPETTGAASAIMEPLPGIGPILEPVEKFGPVLQEDFLPENFGLQEGENKSPENPQ